MGFVESALNPGTIQEVEYGTRAARVALRPLDYTLPSRVLGHFNVVMVTSAIAPAANAVLGAMRWTDANNFAVILRARAFVTVVTAVTAQRNDPLVASIARGYTARDLTNATAITITGNNMKRRVAMGSSLVANLDVANAAAGLTGGTKTVDAQPHSAVPIGASGLVGLGTNGGGEIFNSENNYLHPPVLSTNEGLLISWGTTALATGTVTVTMELAWAEVASF